MDRENEDLDYNFGSEVLNPKDTKRDPDVKNVPVLREVSESITALIDHHNTFDVIDNSKNATLTIKQQVEMHKTLVKYLRQVRDYVDSKVRELK